MDKRKIKLTRDEEIELLGDAGHFKPKKWDAHANAKYNPDVTPGIAREILSQGFSQKAAMGKMCIHINTWAGWKKKYPEFLQAIEEGLSQGQLAWEELAQIPNHPQFHEGNYKTALNKFYGLADKSDHLVVVADATQAGDGDAVQNAVNTMLGDPEVF